MSCKYLVSVFLFCVVAVMGASVVNVSSSSNDSLSSNSTLIRPKLVTLPVNLTALNSTSKASNISDAVSNNKTKTGKPGVIVPRSIDSVQLKNLSALNSTSFGAKNASLDKSNDKALNGTKASNATVNSSSKVERSVNSSLNSTVINRNDTKQVNSSADSVASIKLSGNSTSSSNSSKIVVRAVGDKVDSVNSTKALNVSFSDKANVTASSVASARNASSSISSSNKTSNASDKAAARPERPVLSSVTLKANETADAKSIPTLLSKSNASIHLLLRRQAGSEAETADAAVEKDENKEEIDDAVESLKDEEAAVNDE